MPDARTEKTKKALKSALLELLSEKEFDRIGMSELAERAGVSRSTLYQHYSNLQILFDELTIDFHETLQPLANRLKCKDCKAGGEAIARIPYCRALRNAGEYAALVRDSHYLPSMLRASSLGELEAHALKPFLDAGLDQRSAQRMYAFQMSACYNAAMSVESDEEWNEVQRTIDRFISGGLNALRQH